MASPLDPVSTEYYNITDGTLSVLRADAVNDVVALSALGPDGKPMTYTIIDGIPTSEDYPDNAVFIGWDASLENEPQAAALSQDWSGSMGRLRREETVELICAIIVHYGDGDSWGPVRQLAHAVQSDVETKLRKKANLGLEPNDTRQYLTAGFKPSGAFMEPSPDSGFWFRIVFTVSVETRT